MLSWDYISNNVHYDWWISLIRHEAFYELFHVFALVLDSARDESIFNFLQIGWVL